MSRIINEATNAEFIRNVQNESLLSHKSTIIKQCQQCKRFVKRNRDLTFEAGTRNFHCNVCLQIRIMDIDISNQNK